MRRSTFSVAFYLRRTRTNKHGESAIAVKITGGQDESGYYGQENH